MRSSGGVCRAEGGRRTSGCFVRSTSISWKAQMASVPPSAPSSGGGANIPLIAGVAGGAGAGVLCLGIIICLACKYCKGGASRGNGRRQRPS